MAVSVVIDSSIVIQDLHLRGPSMRFLLAAARRGDISLFVPEVVVKEATGKFRERVDEKVEALTTASRKLGDLLGEDISRPDLSVDAVNEKFGAELRAKLSAAGVEVLEIFPVSHEELVDRAIARVPPFDLKGRGYRDTLIWFTVLQQARRGPVIFMSGDVGDFGERVKGGNPILRADLQAELRRWRPAAYGFWLVTNLDELAAAIEDATGVESRRRSDPILVRFRSRLADPTFSRAVFSEIADIVAFEFPTELRLEPGVVLESVSVEHVVPVRIEPVSAYRLEEGLAAIEAHVETDIELSFTVNAFFAGLAGWDPAASDMTIRETLRTSRYVLGMLTRTVTMTFGFIYNDEQQAVTEITLDDEGFGL